MEKVEAVEYQGWSAWANKFKPVNNQFVSDPDQQVFDTHGQEGEYIKTVDNKYVWTWVQGDLSDLIVAGYHYVNRLGYYVTEVPWDNEWDSCLLSEEVECECYKEDGYYDRWGDLEQSGDPDCDKCEGYGYATSYVS
jgi:hypothetical protein